MSAGSQRTVLTSLRHRSYFGGVVRSPPKSQPWHRISKRVVEVDHERVSEAVPLRRRRRQRRWWQFPGGRGDGFLAQTQDVQELVGLHRAYHLFLPSRRGEVDFRNVGWYPGRYVVVIREGVDHEGQTDDKVYRMTLHPIWYYSRKQQVREWQRGSGYAEGTIELVISVLGQKDFNQYLMNMFDILNTK